MRNSVQDEHRNLDPQPLEYHTGQTSPYDPPVEKYLRLTARARLITRVFYWVVMLSAIATVGFYVWKLLSQAGY